MTIQKHGRRGRPRSFDMAEAVAVAEPLFRARGYDAVGVAEIGKALGITPPSFYAAFGSKLGLFERVIAFYEANDASFFPAALGAPGPPLAAIERLLADAAHAYAAGVAPGCLVLDGTRGSADAAAVALTAARRTAAEESVRARIAIDHPDRAAQLARMVMIALRGMSAAARDGVSEADLRAFAQLSFEALARLA